jgi:excisionase family DNA binding protein
MNNLPRGLRPEEAAQVLGLSADSYYRHVRPAVLQGDILSVRIGRNVRILTASLLTWWEQQAIEQRERWKR